jgi:hypothetical protein
MNERKVMASLLHPENLENFYLELGPEMVVQKRKRFVFNRRIFTERERFQYFLGNSLRHFHLIEDKGLLV